MADNRVAVLDKNNNVLAVLVYPEGDGYSQAMYAGLLSNPVAVEVPNNSLVDLGWTYDGQNFEEGI
jgi:hypothetical protein